MYSNYTSTVFQIAPMVDWTNSPFRIFMRLMLPKVKLYTEMLVPQAIINQPQRHLGFDEIEHPLVLQLGGSEPQELVKASRLACEYGYDEINLNLGCPSPRVQAGAFGACLMKDKILVKRCLDYMHQHLNIPITAKIRIGVDDLDSYEYFYRFVEQIISTGCQEIIVHARKAWLTGLNPKQNRTIPPINYDFVYRIQQDFPKVNFVINGEIKTLEQIKAHIQSVKGVMLGRLACDNPYQLVEFHQYLFPEEKVLTRQELVSAYLNQIDYKNIDKKRISIYLKPLFNLYHGTIYAKKWKNLVQSSFMTKTIDIYAFNTFSETDN